MNLEMELVKNHVKPKTTTMCKIQTETTFHGWTCYSLFKTIQKLNYFKTKH